MTDARESEAAERASRESEACEDAACDDAACEGARTVSERIVGLRGTPVAAARQAREMYLAGHPLRAITAQTGLTPGRVHYWADREIAADGQITVVPRPRRRPRAVGTAPPSPRRRRALAHRLWRAAERQVEEIEARMAALACVTPFAASPFNETPSGETPAGGTPSRGTLAGGTLAGMPAAASSAEAERDARALAVLARVLRELNALDADEAKRRAAPLPAAQEAAPYDLDSFRRELARRLEDLRGAGDGAAAS